MNMTIDEMCEYLRISRSTLWRLRKRGLPSALQGLEDMP